eukprot:755441-Hanusia_phi.AAC.2
MQLVPEDQLVRHLHPMRLHGMGGTIVEQADLWCEGEGGRRGREEEEEIGKTQQQVEEALCRGQIRCNQSQEGQAENSTPIAVEKRGRYERSGEEWRSWRSWRRGVGADLGGEELGGEELGGEEFGGEELGGEEFGGEE